ncbi:MAG: HigA family addiction module antitoxin [Parvularculaceae bacterium]|nr:HigA family addiction module antitoxin [Parvularculaceae bacterium]
MGSPANHPANDIRAALDAAGMTVVAAAKRLGVSRQQLTRVIGKKSSLSAEMALRIETLFGLPAKNLLEAQLESDLIAARKKLRAERRGALSAPQRGSVLRRLRSERAQLTADGVEALYLFGSVARGDAAAASDVDLYFIPTKDASIGLIELGRLTSRLEGLLGRKVDLAPFDSLRPAVMERARHDQVRVF